MSRKFIILPEQHNTVIKKYNDGMNMKQIANEINVSKTAVRNVLLFYNTSILDIKGHRRYKNNKKYSELIIGGNKQAMKFLKFLYTNSTIYLQRKHDKYLLFKNDYE